MTGELVTGPSIPGGRSSAWFAVRRSRVDRIGLSVLPGAAGLGNVSSVENASGRQDDEVAWLVTTGTSHAAVSLDYAM